MSTSIPTPTSTSSNPQPSSSSSSALPQLPSKAYYNDHAPRLFLPLHTRFITLNTFAFGTGFTLGASIGHRRTSLRFRAENAHRLPTTKSGWYFYHKSKNYQVIKGGLKEGVRSGVRLMGWASLFVVVEAGLDGMRRYTDALSTMAAGGVTGAAFGIINKLQWSTVMITAKRGLVYGLMYGVTQDVVRKMKGESVFYMDPFIDKPKEQDMHI